MDDNTRTEFTVNGFVFGSKDDVELAAQELSTARYIENKIDGRNLETIKAVYQGALEKKLFRTPVGYAYLHELQKKMLSMGLTKEELQPIPLYQIYNNKLEEQPRAQRTVRVRKRKDELHRKNATLTTAVVILALLVVALFIISFTGSNPNVLNYRHTVENEYAQWEQELKERENAVREKERELNITYTAPSEVDYE